MCKDCKYCYPYKRFNDSESSTYCCVLFPMTEHDGYVYKADADDMCEMFTERVKDESKTDN